MKSKLEALFELQLKAHKIVYVMEYRFCERMWRFDFAFPERKVAVEIQGGTFIRGSHSRGMAQKNDFQKLNRAQLLGWVVLQYDTDQIRSGDAIKEVAALLNE